MVLVQTVLVLVGVCLLAVVTLRWGHRRFGTSGGPLEVLARLPLEPRRSLLVVRVGARTVMLASSEAGVQSIGELDASEAQALRQELVRAQGPVVSVSRETSEVA